MKAFLMIPVLFAVLASVALADDSLTVILNNKTYTCSEGGSAGASCRVLKNGESVDGFQCNAYAGFCAVLFKYGAETQSSGYYSAQDAASACDAWLKSN